MKWSTLISRCLPVAVISGLVVGGCDSVDVADRSELVHPRVSIVYLNEEAASAKTGGVNAIIDVRLDVVSPSGTDYSPEPVQVDDTVDDEARFELSLPPDSLFTFTASLTRNGELVAEGRVLQFVNVESSEVLIPVVLINQEPFFAFYPSQVETNVIAGSMGLEMRLYGSRSGIVGLAVELNETGSDPADVSFQDVDLVESRSGRHALAWQFGQAGPEQRVGTIEVPVDEAADFCLDIEEGDVRVVNRSGQIRVIGGSGACIHVIQ